jgi:L-lactate dehydrogenase (cytochrome)/(S)-mandelate dehydrogenase
MPATIDVLPSIALAVGHRVPVFFDGGIRCGSDIVVALCLGAQLGFVGRASLYGVSAGGRAGADRALQILRDELSQTLAMIGCPNIAALGSEFIFDPGTV